MKIKVLSIKPEAIDEWYGVSVRFEWIEPPAKIDSDDIPQAKEIARLIVASPEYASFYDKKHTVTCEDGEDGPDRRVTIPRFGFDDFCDWGYNAKGGWLSASDR